MLVGAGDIGMCATGGAAQTARLLDGIAGTVFTTGDNAYMRGTADEFRNCYEPTWGRHRARTRPVPGNHEYETGGAGYYAFFGDRAGPGGAGYYSYGVGPWRVIALNSEISSVPGSAQMEWLREELVSPRSLCTAVYWHRPLFTSGPNGDNPDLRNVWRTLYEANVDLVINGHDHIYERFAPQDPDGRPDFQRGIRQFIVGTGGATLYQFPQVRANSEARASVWGVAVFTLSSGGYQWEFVPVEGAGFRDSGAGVCH
ncbi:MAG: metallophosphoesterase [Acidobacteriota bacterium]